MSNKVVKNDLEWREQLSDEQYRVTREKGTERAFTGEYYNCSDDGVYCCICCGSDLFDSAAKYDSGSGWPSYSEAISDDCISLKVDGSLYVQRTEVLCQQCEAHLGHVFDDGPEPTGKRFCINSVALKLKKL